jgi:anhydro-N-acetylmuramic acid kinase
MALRRAVGDRFFSQRGAVLMLDQPQWAVGLMTGTVLDGNIDVALLKTNGETIEAFGAYTLSPYPDSTRARFLNGRWTQARAWNFEGPEPAIFRRGGADVLTRGQSAAVRVRLSRPTA